jgi:hypothetical protein
MRWIDQRWIDQRWIDQKRVNVSTAYLHVNWKDETLDVTGLATGKCFFEHKFDWKECANSEHEEQLKKRQTHVSPSCR